MFNSDGHVREAELVVLNLKPSSGGEGRSGGGGGLMLGKKGPRRTGGISLGRGRVKIGGGGGRRRGGGGSQQSPQSSSSSDGGGKWEEVGTWKSW